MGNEESQLASDFNPARLRTISRAREVFDVGLEEISSLTEAYDALPLQVIMILENEWDVDTSVQKTVPHLNIEPIKEPTRQSFKQILTLAARVLISTRITIRNEHDLPGDVYVDISQLISQMNKQRGVEMFSDISIVQRGAGNVIAEFSPKNQIDIGSFKQANFSELLGSNIVVIGIGGGSDGCQAAQEALCMRRSGKNVQGVFDVRRMKDCTQEKIEALDRIILQQNAGERLGDAHVWKITSPVHTMEQFFGSGRFMTDTPSADVPMYLVLDAVPEIDTASTIQTTLDYIGDIDAVYAVDTGGDSLYPIHAASDNAPVTTPDQDLAVLLALERVRLKIGDRIYFGSSIIAPGIDMPMDAQERLVRAGASYIPVSDDDRDEILRLYRKWDMTGDNPARFGVTPFVWQAALRGEYGIQVLPLPEMSILNKNNPWNPFRVVLPNMSGIVVMDLEDHIREIASS